MNLCTAWPTRCKKVGGIWPPQLLWVRRPCINLPTKFGCDRSIVVGCRSQNDRHTDKQNGMTIRLTLCDANVTQQTDRQTDRRTDGHCCGVTVSIIYLACALLSDVLSFSLQHSVADLSPRIVSSSRLHIAQKLLQHNHFRTDFTQFSELPVVILQHI